MPATYEYYRQVFRDTPMPFAFVDLDRLGANADQIARRARSKRVRLGTKGVRCAALLRSILRHSPQFAGLMCFSAAEAVFLSRKGFDDLLLAYPVWQRAQLEAVCDEVRGAKKIVVTFDSAAQLERLDAIAAARGARLPVCLDLDVASRFPFLHFGAHWSEISTRRQIESICRELDRRKQVKLVGLLGYEAQIAGLPDEVDGEFLRNRVVRLLKSVSAREVRRTRAIAVETLGRAGHRLELVNGGGTGSLDSNALDQSVTEVTAGSGFYAPGYFDHYRGFRHLPAAGYAVEITRKASSGRMVCHGGGYNASGVANALKEPVPWLPEGVELTRHEGAGEVQTPIRYRGEERLELGDPIFFRHAKAGELCERVNVLHLVSAGRIVERAATYRGEGMCFL
jgi:D-serine deaminase-like pyridoxal phosphate-dependent protein